MCGVVEVTGDQAGVLCYCGRVRERRVFVSLSRSLREIGTRRSLSSGLRCEFEPCELFFGILEVSWELYSATRSFLGTSLSAQRTTPVRFCERATQPPVSRADSHNSTAPQTALQHTTRHTTPTHLNHLHWLLSFRTTFFRAGLVRRSSHLLTKATTQATSQAKVRGPSIVHLTHYSVCKCGSGRHRTGQDRTGLRT